MQLAAVLKQVLTSLVILLLSTILSGTGPTREFGTKHLSSSQRAYDWQKEKNSDTGAVLSAILSAVFCTFFCTWRQCKLKKCFFSQFHTRLSEKYACKSDPWHLCKFCFKGKHCMDNHIFERTASVLASCKNLFRWLLFNTRNKRSYI